MSTMILPKGIDTATVKVDGKTVGVIAMVETSGAYEGLDGRTHRGGMRWLPEGLPGNLSPGPTHRGEAALLLLAMHGYDVEKVAAPLVAGAAKVRAA